MNFDFGKAFQQGIEAANADLKVKEEINSVFQKMSKAILAASNDRIKIFLDKHPETLQGLTGLTGLAGLASKVIATDPLKNYILARDVVHGVLVTLGTWEPSPAGYPCKIAYCNQIDYCNDKESIEVALSKMLAHPEIGKKMTHLLSQNPTERPT